MPLYRRVEEHPADPEKGFEGERFEQLDNTNEAGQADLLYADKRGGTITFTPVKPSEVRADEMIDLLSSEDEGANYHDFCNVYQPLYRLIRNHAGKRIAKRILYELAESGSLRYL